MTMTDQDRIEKALDTLAELCDYKPGPDVPYEHRESFYNRRTAAEEILRHYREKVLLKEIVVELNVNGAIPVRPMTRTEAGATP